MVVEVDVGVDDSAFSRFAHEFPNCNSVCSIDRDPANHAAGLGLRIHF
jgi:hypothetical protein